MDNLMEVEFDTYCETCRHNYPEGKFNEETGLITQEEYIPCCYCLETAYRDGSKIPEYWEEKV